MTEDRPLGQELVDSPVSRKDIMELYDEGVITREECEYNLSRTRPDPLEIDRYLMGRLESQSSKLGIGVDELILNMADRLEPVLERYGIRYLTASLNTVATSPAVRLEPGAAASSRLLMLFGRYGPIYGVLLLFLYLYKDPETVDESIREFLRDRVSQDLRFMALGLDKFLYIEGAAEHAEALLRTIDDIKAMQVEEAADLMKWISEQDRN